MKYLISLLAFLLIGCDGEKSNAAPSEGPIEEAASEAKPPEAVSVNPNLKYEIKGDAVTITGRATGASGELIIPANIEGKPVTSIGGYAFRRCTHLKSITIPDGVTSIGNSAFAFCESLKSITIPDGVTSIGRYAFYVCTSLKSITIPDSVTSIGDNAFRDCSSLTSITIPDSVTSIGNYAFGGCDRLTSITIPDSVISIGTALFGGCRSLKSITIPDSVTSIGEHAFYDCTSLTSINIPNGVTSIGREAFGGCTNLTTIKVGAENLNYTDVEGVLFNKKKTLLHTYPAGKADANYATPDRVTSIREGRRYPMDQQIANASRQTIKRNFKAFMTLPEGSGQTQFIDRSADLSLAFSDYYRENPFPRASGTLTQTGVNVLKLPKGELAVESIWKDSEGHQWGVLHLLDKTTSRWKLDWENFAPYSTESWSKFINRLDGSSNEGTFRVLVTKRRTTDDGKKISLNFYRAPHIKEDDGEFKKSESPEIDLLAGSDLAKEFMQLWNNHQKKNDPMGSILGRALDPNPTTYMRITVRLGWKDNKRDKEVLELKEIIGAGWFGERIIKLRKTAKDADTLAGRPVIDREQANSWLDDIEKANRNTKEIEDSELAAKDVDDFEEFDNAKVEKAIRDFVTAESPAELKKYIRDSERVGPLLDRYYERVDYEAEGFEALDMTQMKYNGDVVTMLVQKADFLSSPIAVERVVDGEEESYQIDWESWVGYCDYTPEQMRAEKPDKPFLMRVVVKPVNYYNYDFSEDGKWRSLGLELKDSIHSFIGYVETASEQDKKFRVMMKGGQVVACMVRVAYPTGSRSNDQVEILEIVGSGWMQNLKKDK